jgi:hypothetical protein
MRSKYFRLALAGFSVLTLVAAALVAGLATSSSSEAKRMQQFAKRQNGMTLSMARMQALPGNGGMGEGAEGSLADQLFLAKALPGDDIPLSSFVTERAAADKAKIRFKKGKKGDWASLGPDSALYPFFEMRDASLYVPNAYVAAQRTTALAIEPACKKNKCRLYAATSGGGVWTTKDALDEKPKWEYLSASFGINAIGAITIDPNDSKSDTLWAGTGEGNTCASGCVAGVGLYKSTDGGKNWSEPLGTSVFNARGIGQIVVKPGDSNTIYAGSTRVQRGMSSVCCASVTSLIPGAPKWGLYKSTDGGASWSYIFNGAASTAGCTGDITEALNGTPCSPRGVRHVELDPSDPNTVYASAYARGIWRSNDGGTTWTQIKTPLISTPAVTTDRAAFAVTKLPNGKTRMYVYEGASGTPVSRAFRTDDAQTATPASGWVDLTPATNDRSDDRWGSYNLCTGQCWYDNFAYTPAGYPDYVYFGGSYSYGQTIANKRGVVLSRNAGGSYTDMTFDATDAVHPNGLHPDQHALVTNPNNPLQFFESNDGGVMRSSGVLADRSADCAGRGLNAVDTARCQQMLSAIPSTLLGINDGITTLQFWSLSVNPRNTKNIQGGTQDNGTWETGNAHDWQNTMIGDGGQSGFDATLDEFRFHTYFDAQPDVNFSSGATADWNWIGDPIAGHPGTMFYVPIISDPVVSKTMFVGTGLNVYRTQTAGLGSMTLAQLRQHCNEWTGDGAATCGDWVPIATPGLNDAAYGDRAGGAVVAIERTKADTGTAWAATQTGRVFVSKNADAPAATVTWKRIDLPTTPNRFVSSIYIDPANGNRAWVSFNGFNSVTPATPGHIFEVVYNPVSGTATWTNLDHDLGDIATTDLVRDDVTGDLYAANDFGVLRLEAGTTSWTLAAGGMPNVAVSGLTVLPTERVLFAATHGLGAWRLDL